MCSKGQYNIHMKGLGQHGSFDFKAPKTGDTVPEGGKQRNREAKLDGLGGQKGSRERG